MVICESQSYVHLSTLISSQLTAAFFVETLVWGFPTIYGIFLAAYLKDARFNGQKHASSLLPLIGTLSSGNLNIAISERLALHMVLGVMYCSSPLVYPWMANYPHHRRSAMWTGLVLCWASLFGASYATQVCMALNLPCMS
jgi:MFS transporter, MCT family, solute carrier family 16 (monocarboxylic acid transporters), member 10